MFFQLLNRRYNALRARDALTANRRLQNLIQDVGSVKQAGKPLFLLRNQHMKLYGYYTDYNGTRSTFPLAKHTIGMLEKHCIPVDVRDVTMLDAQPTKDFIKKCHEEFRHVEWDLKNNQVCCYGRRRRTFSSSVDFT